MLFAGDDYIKPIHPSDGLSRSGSAISALTPHTIVVSPHRINEDPFAVEIEPTRSKTSFKPSSTAKKVVATNQY